MKKTTSVLALMEAATALNINVEGLIQSAIVASITGDSQVVFSDGIPLTPTKRKYNRRKPPVETLPVRSEDPAHKPRKRDKISPLKGIKRPLTTSCKHCHKPLTAQGVYPHEKWCAKNPKQPARKH